MAGSDLIMPLLGPCRDPVRRPGSAGDHAADDTEALRGNAVVVRGIGIVDQLRSGCRGCGLSPAAGGPALLTRRSAVRATDLSEGAGSPGSGGSATEGFNARSMCYRHRQPPRTI